MTVPTTITPEEYRSHWEPEGWQLLIIGPTSSWRQDWKEWESIRDIVQNALDEAEAYSWGYDSQGLWIADQGKGLQVADLLLGPPKLKPPHARGRFGEGMKIAALALLRLGYGVRVDTVGKEIMMVFLQQKTNGSAETLAAIWKPDGAKVGTRFHILDYFGDAFEDRFAVNLPRKHLLHEGPSPLAEPMRRFNQLLESPPGRIYARDIYLRDIDSPWSYNLWGFEMAPDRHGPKDEDDLWADMGRLWCTCTRVDLLERFLGRVTCPPPERSAEERVNMSSWDMGREPVTGRDYSRFVEEQRPAWQEAWNRAAGSDAVIRTRDRLDGTVQHLGYRSITVTHLVMDTLAQAITTDQDLVRESQERLREVQIVPDERLTLRQLAHLKLARDICGLLFHPIPAVHAALIPPASDRVRTAGLYSRSLREIYIALEQLEHARTVVDTLIHEMAHHSSGAEDGDPLHNAEMTRVAAKVVEATARGQFDELLAEAIW